MENMVGQEMGGELKHIEAWTMLERLVMMFILCTMGGRLLEFGIVKHMAQMQLAYQQLNGKYYNVDYGHLSKSTLSIEQPIKAGDLVVYGTYGKYCRNKFSNTCPYCSVETFIWKCHGICTAMVEIRNEIKS